MASSFFFYFLLFVLSCAGQTVMYSRQNEFWNNGGLSKIGFFNVFPSGCVGQTLVGMGGVHPRRCGSLRVFLMPSCGVLIMPCTFIHYV